MFFLYPDAKNYYFGTNQGWKNRFTLIWKVFATRRSIVATLHLHVSFSFHISFPKNTLYPHTVVMWRWRKNVPQQLTFFKPTPFFETRTQWYCVWVKCTNYKVINHACDLVLMSFSCWCDMTEDSQGADWEDSTVEFCHWWCLCSAESRWRWSPWCIIICCDELTSDWSFYVRKYRFDQVKFMHKLYFPFIIFFWDLA